MSFQAQSVRRIALVAGISTVLLTIWLLNVSRPGRAPIGCPAGCASTAARAPGPLRVLSLNMLHGFPTFEHLDARLAQIAVEIRRLDADIVLLQEVPWTMRYGSAAKHLAAATGLNHLYLRANGNRWAILFEEGEAVLSRFPLRDPASVELTPPAARFEHRVALAATAQTPWGDLRLVVTHLTNGAPEANAAQAASLTAFVGAGPVPAIVAGDFNARDDSPQIRSLSGNWIDAFRAVRPQAPGPTCCVDDLRAGPEEPFEKRIDYLFLVPGPGTEFTIRSTELAFAQPYPLEDGWLWSSDHLGLLVEIELGTAPSGGGNGES